MKTVFLQFLLAEIVIGDVLYDYLQSNLLFTQDYYKKFTVRHANHFIFSPASVQATLGMVALGAEGESQSQLIELAHFHFNASTIAEIYLKLGEKLLANQTSLISSFGINIEMASLNSPYRTYVEDIFKARVAVNTFPPTSNISLVATDFLLTNGIIFKHRFMLPEKKKWNTMFYNGRVLRYYFSKTDSVIIDTLNVRQKLNYYNNTVLKAEFVEIPITDNEIMLTIVLPYKTSHLSIVETNISEVLRSQRYQTMNVSVTVPKIWEENYEYLTNYLKSYGTRTPFTSKADFTKATIPHTQIIEVSHATIFSLSKGSSDDVMPSVSSVEINFTVDHPFLYYIKHSSLGVIAIGRFIKPNTVISQHGF